MFLKDWLRRHRFKGAEDTSQREVARFRQEPPLASSEVDTLVRFAGGLRLEDGDGTAGDLPFRARAHATLNLACTEGDEKAVMGLIDELDEAGKLDSATARLVEQAIGKARDYKLAALATQHTAQRLLFENQERATVLVESERLPFRRAEIVRELEELGVSAPAAPMQQTAPETIATVTTLPTSDAA